MRKALIAGALALTMAGTAANAGDLAALNLKVGSWNSASNIASQVVVPAVVVAASIWVIYNAGRMAKAIVTTGS